VLGLAERLRQAGADAQIDQYVAGTPPEGWPRWMLDRLDWAEFVLVICTETYYRRFRGHEEPSKGKGADWEGNLITLGMYGAKSKTTKFAAVLFTCQDEQFIPEPLRGHTQYLLNAEESYANLYAFLTGQAGVTPGELGSLKMLARTEVEALKFGAADTPTTRPIHNLPFPPNPAFIQDLGLDLLSSDAATRYLLERVARRRHNAGDEAAAWSIANELGHLPLALEQAAAFIIEVRWSFDKYREQLRDARPELLSEHWEGGTRYPASVAKTWSITLEQLSLLARSFLRIAAWFAPDAIPRSVFSADRNVLAEALGEEETVSDLAFEKALGELDRFSLIHLTAETVSVHRLLQAVEQDSLGEEERKRWLLWAARLFNAVWSASPNDVRSFGVWLSLAQHGETLIEHAKHCHVDALPIALVANNVGLFLNLRGFVPVILSIKPILSEGGKKRSS